MKYSEFPSRWREIACFIPIYDSTRGNCTEIWLDSGEKAVVPQKVSTVLHMLGRVFSLDLCHLKQQQRKRLKKGKLVPLPLHYEMVLVPLKVREPRVKDDGAFGYVVYNRVAGYDDAGEPPYLSWLALTNGMVLKTYHTRDTIDERLHQAEIVLKNYRHLYLLDKQEKKPPRIEDGQVIYLMARCPRCQFETICTQTLGK